MSPHPDRLTGGVRVYDKFDKKSALGKPLVSIITVSLNSAKTITRTIESILNQNYENIEHIIIDGGSTDRTLDILRKYDDKIAYWLSEPDRGISDAFNKGLDSATGEIITFLNSDDYYPDIKLIGWVAEEFNNNKSVKILYGKVALIHPETDETLAVKGWDFNLKRLKRYMTVPHQSIFARRAVYETVGNFNLNYTIAMDYDFLLRALKLYSPHYMDKIIAVMSIGGKSDRYVFKAFREFYKIQRENGVNFIKALETLIVNYFKTSVRLLLEKAGLKSIVQLYRKLTNQL